MSSTMSSTVSSTATDASETGSSPPSIGSGTNYFFGFLIAFIAFLFVFLSLGLLARRRRLRIMRDFLLYGDDDSPNITQTEPLMWQPMYTMAEGQLWSDIMPLSISLVQRVVDDKVEEPPHPSRSRYLGFPSLKTPNGPQKIQVTEAMNIAVMIELPQAPEALEEVGIHEYQIGILHVPWKDGMDEELPETS
ncbi:hypothetical protein B0H12DRAFT_1324040 [Mycena haematopus]|nr:hypothetical protein B0H12DRAFT_1324040 [Mycena haematopus]